MNNKKICFAIAFLMLMILMLSAQLSYSQGSVRAWSFSGVNSYVNCAHIDLSRQTIEAWIKIDDFTGKKRAIYSNGNDYNLLVTESAGSYYIEYWVKAGGAWLKQKSKTLLKSNTWYHIAAAYDGYSISILLNGYADNMGHVGNTSYNNLPSTNNNYIGGSTDTQFGYFTGVIDEIRIWSYPVAQSDIHHWMGIPLNDKHPNWENLERYYKCDETVLRNNYLDIKDSKNYTSAKPFNITSYIYPSIYKRSSVISHHAGTIGDDSFYDNSPKSVAVYYNKKIHQFGSYDNFPYTRQYKGHVDADNNIVLEYKDQIANTVDRWEYPVACCVFKDKLAYVSYKNIDDDPDDQRTTEVRHYIGNIADDNDDSYSTVTKSPHIYRKLEVCVPPAYAVLNDTLYFFNIDRSTGNIVLNVDYSVDGTNFHFLRRVNTGSTGLDYYRGNVAACKSIDNEGNEVIYLAYRDRDRTRILLKRFYRNREEDEASIPVPSVRNFSIVPGNVNGGISSGYALQLFYSADTPDKFGHDVTVGRIEYSIEDKFFYQPEQLDIAGYDGPWSNNIEMHKFWPYAFTYYQTEGSTGETLGQKIIMTLQNNDNNKQTNWYFCWDSNKMTYIPEADAVDTHPGDKVSQLLGVIEGPPPYVLNGEDLGELIKIQSYPSFLEFGSSSGQNNEKTVSVDKSWDVSFRYEGLGGDFEHHAESATQTEYSSKSYESRTVFPVEGRNRGYLVFLRPIITRKKFQLTDANNNLVDNVYSLEISDRFIDYVPYYLDTVAHAPNPKRLASYMNRDVDLESYMKIYSANYSWTGGTKTTAGFETDNSVTKSTSEEFYKGFGISVSVDVGYGEFVEISTNLFNFESHIGTTSKHEGSTTISNSRNISVNTECPFNGLKGDTAYFSAIVYWIKPTDGKINWWVPKGYEKHKPWCITYKVNNFFGHPYSGLDDIKYSGMFAIYPNPANDFITIDIKNQKIAKLEAAIYNIIGQSVYSATINTLNAKINISNLDDGIYFLKLTGKNLYATEKILIRH